MNIINLENLNGIPIDYINRLKKYNLLFKKHGFLEEILEEKTIEKLANEINDFCMQNLIIGFHYTRAIPEDIIEYGLTCRSGEEIRNSFLNKHSNHFTFEEIECIKNQWENYFDNRAKKSRDNRIYFNLTKTALNDNGAQPLLAHYGGEQIYMPIHNIPQIKQKIKEIGKPLILKCVLNPNNLNPFHENSYGRIVVSSYHNKINSEAIQADEDFFQSVNIPSSNIEILEYNGNLHFC
jgi:hypothetical protein